MSLWRRLRDWWSDPRRKLRRRAIAELQLLFGERRALLAGTSLKPQHRTRVRVLDVREEPFEILFGILRHPRPYPFSRQYHEVLELWCYRVHDGVVERLEGHNLSRARGEDGDPSSFGTGV